MELEIKDLRAGVDGREILTGVSLRVGPGEIHAIMGPNGSGKSTLGNVIMGHPKYSVLGGDVRLNGESLLQLTPDERARRGLFLGFQYPHEVPGVATASFLKTAQRKRLGRALPAEEFMRELRDRMAELKFDESLLRRGLNEGFSGGEKKRCEVLQLAVLRPGFAILDEPDSGLDIDALRLVAETVKRTHSKETGLLLITHYKRILEHIRPDFVHVMVGGRIVRSGGPELADRLDEYGYGKGGWDG